MKLTLKIEKEYDVQTLHVNANVRYWEDAKINGVEDTDGTLTPCRNGDSWCPVIDVECGKIINWKDGVTASIHFKVCDEGIYTLKTACNDEIISREGYVPSCLCPKRSGYGDYIIMDIDGDGKIDGWNFNPSDFEQED